MTRGALAALLWCAALPIAVVPLAVLGQARSSDHIELSIPSVVTILTARLQDGQLQPISAGSGTVVSGDGDVLTNHHVLVSGKDGRPYDLFLIGRSLGAGRDPLILCAGTPSAGTLDADLDLAVVRCDSDLNGQPWFPEGWPDIPLGDSEDILPGEQVWILGYSDAGRGGIRISAGLVSGFTGEQGGTSSRAFLRTDASVSAGNSGGAAIDRAGRLIGVPTAFQLISGKRSDAMTATSKIGLVRPIEAARELLAAARRGTAQGGDSDGRDVTVTGRVVEAGSGAPLRAVMVLAVPAGTSPGALDQEGPGLALAWGESDARGGYRLEPPLGRGTRYQLAAVAPGWRPLVEEVAREVPVGRHKVAQLADLALVRSRLGR